MSYTFVNKPSVGKDIIEATDYYKKNNPKLAKQFLLRIRQAKTHINRSPFGFQIKYKSVRTLLLKQFPYQIHYLVDDTKKTIVILAIIHSYKNPKDYSDS